MVDSEHYVARENIVELQDANLGSVLTQNVLGVLSGTPGQVASSAPGLGDHTTAILVDKLGFSPSDICTTEES